MLVILRRMVLMAGAMLVLGSLTIGLAGCGGAPSSGPVEAVDSAPVANPVSPAALEPEKPADTPR